MNLPLWHVTVTYRGAEVDLGALRAALERLTRERPFLTSARYACDRVELRYWDEAEDVDDAAAMALRLWNEHRGSASLPDWQVVGLEVVDRETLVSRGERGLVPASAEIGDLRPL